MNRVHDDPDRFRQLLEMAPDAIMEVDHHGRIVLMNAATERIFGYQREELRGQSVETLIPGAFRSRHVHHRSQYLAQPATRPMGSGLRLIAERKDGTEFPVEISLSPVNAAEGIRVTAIIRDVTERKQAEEQIKAMHERLTRELTELNRQLESRNIEAERANRLKSEFMASMSHELRTPLHTIIGFSELLAEESQGPLNDKQKRYVNHIHRDSLHLLELINDILDLSRIEAGRLDLRCALFDAKEAAEEVASSIRTLAAPKNIKVSVAIPDDLTIYADRVRFKEILTNLLSNAVKFTPNGGRIHLSAATAGRGILEGMEAHFSVKDTGIGIPVEEQEAIFDTFYQAGPTTKGVREGTGLGLAICRHLVTKQGGRLWVESVPGQGSEFQFTLPLQAPDEQAVVPPQPLVLIAEPEEAARELLISYVGPQGFRTETALSVEEMLRKVKDLRPHAIALDLAMVNGGWPILQRLLKAQQSDNIPVIVISSRDQNESAIALGAAAYLVKPVKKEVFLETIRNNISPKPGEVTRVLVVDDEPDSVQLLQEVLSLDGFVPLCCVSGREALEILARTKVDVAIIDLIMPEMTGFELILRIKENPRLDSLPIVVLTGQDLTELDYNLLQRKTKAVFLKATSWQDELLRRLHSISTPIPR